MTDSPLEMESTTVDAATPIASTTSPESVNLPLAIALPICLFVFLFFFVVILVVCLVRKKKKCSQKPVESQMSRGSVEGSSDNGDNNNNDGETGNHQTHGMSADGEILPVDGKTFVDDDSPVVEHRKSCARNPDEESQRWNEKDEDDVETTARTIVEGEENTIPVSVVCERRTSDVAMETVVVETVSMETDAMETVAVAPPVGQQSQLQETAIEIPTEEQDNVQTYAAVYSFEAEHENQMSLAQDDIVLVSKAHEHEGWLCGWKRNSAETGWFPKSHVREVEQLSIDCTAPSLGAYKSSSYGRCSCEDDDDYNDAMRTSAALLTQLLIATLSPNFFRETSVGSKLSDSTEHDDDFDEDVGKYECRALYSFDGAEEGELSFNAGDSLLVHQGVEGTGWLYGQRGDKVGWFPETYVEVIAGSNALTSSDIDSTTSTKHDIDGALQRVAKIAPMDITPEGSLLSPSVNSAHHFPGSSEAPAPKITHKTYKEDAPPPSEKSMRSFIPSGKPNISDRLGLSKIKKFRKRKSSTDEPVILKEVVLVPSLVSPGENLHDETSVETQQKQTKSSGKKGKKERLRQVLPPPPSSEDSRRQSLFKLHNRKREKMEMSSLSSCNGNQSSDDQHLTLPHDTNTSKPSKDSVSTTEERDASKVVGAVAKPTEDTKTVRDVVSEESDCIVMSLPKTPLQSKADDRRRQWDMTLENFDRILDGSNDFDDGARVPAKPTNLVSSLSNGLSRSVEKTPSDHRDRSIPQVTHPAAAVNGSSGPLTLHLTPPSPTQVSSRRRREERSKNPAPIREDEVSRKSELELLSFAPPGFNDSEEVLSEKFLSYLSQVGSIDKSRLLYPADGRGINRLQRQSSLHHHPSLPPKPSWPPPADETNEEHRQKDGDVFKEDSNDDGALTFIVQSGRSSRQSLSTLLLPDVVRGYITTDEYEDFQIPPPAGFSTDSENVGRNSRVVSLDSFREIQTPRYFGRTFVAAEEDDSSDDDSPVPQDARWPKTVSERVEDPADTETVVWRPWGHSEPKFTRNSYAKDVETHLDSSRSRHDTSSRGVMFKLADGSVVFDESDVGLESVI